MLQALPSSRGYRAKAASVPAPVGGLNSRDSIDAMPPTDALIMSNFFPTVEKVTLRMAIRHSALALAAVMLKR